MNVNSIIKGIDFPLNKLKLVLFSFLLKSFNILFFILFGFLIIHILFAIIVNIMTINSQDGIIKVDGSKVEKRFIIFNL